MLCKIDTAWQNKRDSMRSGKRRWLLVGLLCLGLWAMVAPSAQETRWESITADAAKAYQQADYAHTEKLLLAALKEAEKFGEQDPRLAISLKYLAELYDARYLSVIWG